MTILAFIADVYSPAVIVAAMASSVIGGLVLLGFGQVYLALREIALNSRTSVVAGGGEANSSSKYTGLAFIGEAMFVLGTIVILVALGGGTAILLRS